MLVLVSGCRDYASACDTAVAQLEHGGRDDTWLADFKDRCVRERWSDSRIDCELRAGPGSVLSLFCGSDE